MATKSDMTLIKEYFNCKTGELRDLTLADRRELAEAIKALAAEDAA